MTRVLTTMVLLLLASPAMAQDCTLTIEGNDRLQYNKDTLTVPEGCTEEVTVVLKHVGTQPRQAMGHNWVLVPEGAVQEIGQISAQAGLANGYVPESDKVLAATELIGGGEETSVTVDLSELDRDRSYEFLCTFPGHFATMRGTFEFA